MSLTTIDDSELKALPKQTLIELLEEGNPILYEALAEIVEEMGLVRATQEGQSGPIVSDEKVSETLNRGP